MLEDRSYMRGPGYGQYRSVTVVMLVVLTVCFVLQSILYSYSIAGSRLLESLELAPEAVTRGHVWQLITFQFLHSGFIHFLFNAVSLYFLGKALEISLAPRHWLAIYFGSGIVGGLLNAAGSAVLPMNFGFRVVGASAGVSGLLAAFAFLYPMQEICLWGLFRFPARFLFVISVILSTFFILVPAGGRDLGMAHGAHLGGLFFGYAYARWLIHFEWKMPNLNFFRRPKVFVHKRQPNQWPSQRREKFDLPSDEFISREVDPILDKISAHGIQSLTERERKILEAARAKMARR
jgi:membrane associated rhomboid family serine protease